MKKTDIIKRVGTLHQFRQKLNLEDENLLDEPEFLWEDATLHGQSAICHERMRHKEADSDARGLRFVQLRMQRA